MNKSKFLKKSLAMLLALMLVLAMIPLSASAAELPNIEYIYVGGNKVTLDDEMTVDVSEDDTDVTIGTNINLNDYKVEMVASVTVDGLPQEKQIGQGLTATTVEFDPYAPSDVITLIVYPTDGSVRNPLATYKLNLNRTQDNTTTNLKEVKAVEDSGVYSIDNSIEEINATRTIKVTAAYNASTPKITVTGDEDATINGANTATVGAADDAKLEVVSESGNNTAEYIIETTFVDALNTITVNGVEGVITDTDDNDHNDLITVTLPKDAVLDEYGDPITDPEFEVAFTMYAKTGTISIDSGDPISSPATVKFTGLADGHDYSENLVTTVIGGVQQTYTLKVTIAKDSDTTIDRVLIQTPGQTNVNEVGYPEGDEINIEVPENATLNNSTVTLYTSTTVEKVSVAGVTKTTGYTDEDGQVLPDGRGAGEARALDARGVEEAFGALSQHEVLPGLVGPQAHKGGDDLPHGHVLHAEGGLLGQIGDARGGGGGVLPVGVVHSGGAHQQVPVDGGGYQHALAVFAGQLEDGAAHVAPGGLVQQAVLPFPGGDGELFFAHPVVHLVGVDPGGVYHRPGGKVALVCFYQPALGDLFQPGDGGVEGELHPVFGGALRQAQGEGKGTYDAGGAGPQGTTHLVGEVGLQGLGLVPGEELQVGHAVFQAPLVQLLQLGHLLLPQAHHKGAHPGEGHVQLLGDLVHQLVAPHVHFGF